MTVWAVLAGGKGSRYGEPKATASLGDTTFLGHCLSVVEEASEQGDTIAVSVAVDWQPDIPSHCAVVADTLGAPGPAHSIARLAQFAMDRNEDLVFMAVDMLGVTPLTLRLLRERAAASVGAGRPAVAVARGGAGLHWVLGAVPAPLAPSIVSNADSVSAVQVLLRLCPVDAVDVRPEELLDVNTPELRPD